MKTIRKSIFETNSSSTHTLVITNSDILNLQDSLSFRFGEFGWEFEEYSTPEERASYLWTYLVYEYYDYDKKSYKEAYEWRDKIIDILERHNIECYFDDPETEDTGYVDHGNELKGFFEDMIDHDESKLMRYLFGSGSAIYTGNDNEDDDPYTDDIRRAEDAGYEMYYKGN